MQFGFGLGITAMRGAAVEKQLADFYGTGPGQIPGDWRIDDPVVNGSTITSVRNDGGAGALFALSGSGLPQKQGLYAALADNKGFVLANSADLVGTHFMAVVDATAGGGTLMAQDSGAAENYVNVNPASFYIRERSTFHTINFTNPGKAALFEFRWATSQITLWLNGALVRTIASPLDTEWRAKRIGIGRPDRPAHGFVGTVGRCISVVVDPARSHADPEPAVVVSRRALAKQYGITLV